MNVEKILAISGKPGLYELKIQTRTGFVAESLADKKKLNVGLRSNVSLLSEISIYTNTGEIKLFEIFARIAKKENDQEAISHKESEDKLTAYFSEIVPDYDTDRVYVSDIRKVLNWYSVIQKSGLANVFSTALKQAEEKTEETNKEETEKKKPATKKATTAKKTAEKKETKKAETEKKPAAKKTAKPKAKSEKEDK
ncbi:MAG TPA: DUF5606 domain-containing protein [Flavobacterium sp.]|nr:DUF5606 domain-containing protein [Flavobacterium sp.]